MISRLRAMGLQLQNVHALEIDFLSCKSGNRIYSIAIGKRFRIAIRIANRIAISNLKRLQSGQRAHLHRDDER